MPDRRFSDLPIMARPTGAEIIAAVQQGVSVQGTIDLLMGVNKAELHIYASSVSGADANDGLTPLTPVATLAAAFALVPRWSEANVIVHLASGAYTGEQLPFFVPLKKGVRFWVVGDGAGQPGDTGYTVVTTLTVLTVGASERTVTVSPVLTSYDQYTGLQVHVTTGGIPGRENAVKRCIDSTNTMEFCASMASPTGFVAGTQFELRRSAVYIDYDGPQTLVAGPGSFGTPSSYANPYGGYGLRNVTFRNTEVLSMDLDLRCADVVVYGVSFEGGILFTLTDCRLEGGSFFNNIAVAAANFAEQTAGLSPPVDLVEIGNHYVWAGNGILFENPDQSFPGTNNWLVMHRKSILVGYFVLGPLYMQGDSFIFPTGGRITVGYITQDAFLRLSSTERVCLDGTDSTATLRCYNRSAFQIGSETIVRNRGTGHAILCEDQVRAEISIASEGADGAGARALLARRGAQVFYTGAPSSTGGTVGEDIEVEGQPVFANAALTSGTSVVDTVFGTRVARE